MNSFKILVILIALFFVRPICALQIDSTSTDKQFLLELLEKRKILFNKYSSLEKQKTGLFRSKSKKDIRASKEMLNNIIALDNRIIRELDRLFEHKKFEKLSMGVDMIDYELQLNKHKEGVKILQAELESLRLENQNLDLANNQKLFLNYLLSFFCVVLVAVLLYLHFKKKT